MNQSTYKLHASLIRLAKGMLSAWEAWVKENHEQPKVIENPDPLKYFSQK